MVGARSKQATASYEAGKVLRQARLDRRLTLDDVAVDLRIPPDQLACLEEGDLTIFPAEVYARGAYLRYASYLGVEGRETFNSFLRSMTEVREMVPLKLPRTATWLVRIWTPVGVIVLGIGAAVMLVAGYIGWQVQSFVRLPDLEVAWPNEVVISQPWLEMMGQAERDAVVQINGATVLLREDETWSHQLPLRMGINVIRVEATGAAGRTRVLQKEILRPRT